MAKKLTEESMVPSQEAVARRAYEIWENEGRPDGRAWEHWFRAVSELKAASSERADADEAMPTAKPRTRRSTRPVADKRISA